MTPDPGEQFAPYLAALHGYVRSMTRDDATAEDLVQDTVVRALERRDSLSDPARMRGWLFRIAHNLTVDHYRRLREEPREDVAERIDEQWRPDEYTVDAEAVVARAETAAEVREALVRLPASHRTVVVLRDGLGWSVAEVADVLGIGVPAAKQRLRRGRMMLVSALASADERRAATKGVPMNCWDVRSRVSDFLDGELPADTVTQLTAHLRRCPTCPPLYAALVAARAGVEKLSGLRDPDSVVPPDLAARIRGTAG